MRSKNWRKHQTKRVQKKRIKMWSQGNHRISEEKHKGMMRKTHFGCGCKMCKPWKYFGNNKSWDHKMKPNDRRKAQEKFH